MKYIYRFILPITLIINSFSYGMFTMVTRSSQYGKSSSYQNVSRPLLQKSRFHTTTPLRTHVPSDESWSASYLLKTLTPQSTHKIIEPFTDASKTSDHVYKTPEKYVKILKERWFAKKRINNVATIYADKKPINWTHNRPIQGTGLDAIMFNIIDNQLLYKKLENLNSFFAIVSLKESAELALGMMNHLGAQSANDENREYILNGYKIFNNHYPSFAKKCIAHYFNDQRPFDNLDDFFSLFDAIVEKLDQKQLKPIKRNNIKRIRIKQTIYQDFLKERDQQKTQRIDENFTEYLLGKKHSYVDYDKCPHFNKWARKKYLTLLGLNPKEKHSKITIKTRYHQKLKETHPDTNQKLKNGEITQDKANTEFDELRQLHEIYIKWQNRKISKDTKLNKME